MKTLVFSVIFFLSFCQIGQAQVEPISAKFDTTVALPMLLQRGKTYTIQTDSVFAINGKRWRYYTVLEELMRHNDVGDIDTAYMGMFHSYQKIVDSCEYYFQLLQKNADQTSNKADTFLNNVKTTVDVSSEKLKVASSNLDAAQVRLDSAQVHLTTAIAEIKKAKRRHLWEKIGIGVGSFLIGLLVGIVAK